MGVAAASNHVLKIITLLVFLAGAFVTIRACSSRSPITVSLDGQMLPENVARSELGVEGDTEEETLRTLISEVRRLHEAYATLEADNEALKEQNARLERMEERLANRLEGDLQGAQIALQVENQRVQILSRDTESLL